MNPLKQHPNAIVGGLLGGGALGQGVLQALADAGVHLSSRQSAGISAACAIGTLLLAGPIKYVWSNGVAGLWRRLLHGKAGAGTASLSSSATAPAIVTLDDHLAAVRDLDAARHTILGLEAANAALSAKLAEQPVV